MDDTPTRRVVLGLGNTLNCDEGVGVHALKALEQALGDGADDVVEWIDGGTLGLNLLPLVESCSHLLVLDAADAGQAPGEIVELRKEDISLYTGIKLSQHQATFQEVLGLASFRGKLPAHLHLIGVQPADISIGVDLSPTVEAALPEVAARARRVLDSWGLLRSPTVIVSSMR